MNLRSIDLNLLVVLDALLEEAHVSRAAARIGLSQPAASNALERCRHIFADPLLERRKGGMALTPKAESLRAPLKDALAGLSAVLTQPETDLTTLDQTVRLIMADLPAAIIAGALYARLAETAPNLSLAIHPWRSAGAALDALEAGTSDLAVSAIPEPGKHLRREELLREHYVVAMRREHPAAGDFSLARWLAFPHLVISAEGRMHGALDEALARRKLERHIGASVPSFTLAADIVLKTDLIGMLPSRAVPFEQRNEFAVFDPPIPVDGFALHLAWHARRDQDLATQHVGALIRKLLQ
ncbi:LysR family transcriptional regulator [Hyphococcus luteus]|uniref:LysR family transcriptional regulator n=1 Tax=Hyphococcus luteus TaxID=2058213 RepID=A0A2S7K6D6_9PROT|nr:LysR family transcriptional regulator [Marinicaulis flavus]PQA88070.1 LysR family transcriptional regulator [Marinicaulis flavus]